MPLPEHLERLARESTVTAYKSSGPGGQHKNKTESSIRVKHGPSGITRIATEHRSQMRNRVLALERLWEALEKRARKPKPRRATAPTRAARARRVDEKKRVGLTKRLRRSTDED